MPVLKQNTGVTIKAGPFYASTDGYTGADGLALATSDVRLSKNGGNYAAKASATTTPYDEYYSYDVALSSDDADTLGILKVQINPSTCLSWWQTYTIVPANTYDSLVSGSDYLDVNAEQIASSDSTSAIINSVTDDATRLDGSAVNALVAKIPSKNYLAGTSESDGDINMADAVGNFPGSVASVVGAVASVSGNVDGNVTGSVGSLAAQAKTDVNTEVVDALATDTYAEPGQGAPAATASISNKLGYVYKFLRNKIITSATLIEVYNDAGAVVDQKSTISDDGTDFTRGEFGTGP